MTDEELVKRLSALPVAHIGDSMERLNVMDAGISSVWPNKGAKMVGRAVNVTVAGGDNKGIHETVPTLGAGDVLVVNGQGVMNRALIGELISGRAMVRGAVGFVLDACVRDIDDLEQMRFPVFARGVTPAGPYRNGPYRNGEAVAVGGVVVHPGDWVVGDDDGVAVIPQADVYDVLERAEAKHVDEVRQREEIGF